jgi:predicted nucleotide-binding protein
MEWGDVASSTSRGAPYIGDILQAAFNRAAAVVVLITPDDEAKLRDEFLHPNDPDYERRLTGQARPNVLFEAGMALGHHPDRTILVEFGGVRPFSDVAGRHTIRFTGSPESRHALAERLRAAGCDVNTGGTDWLSEGQFKK